MADQAPNYLVEQQRLKSSIAGQRATIESQKLRIMEMADQKRRHLDNIEAAERSIAECEAKLKELGETHGALTDQTFEAMSATL